MPLRIVRDLDGTRLDHHTYGLGPAPDVLERVARAVRLRGYVSSSAPEPEGGTTPAGRATKGPPR